MAGESPDRSKQRGSSEEPTPGSADSVPEARDPRLAVSREKDSSNGTTDTATKVLSIREVTPKKTEDAKVAKDAKDADDADDAESTEDSDDTALRKAVSSWVRDTNPVAPAKPAPAETSSETKDEAEVEETKAEEEAEAEAEEETEAETEAAPETKAADKAEADDEAEDDKTPADEKAEDDEEAADGEDTPQGPPAADDESRTGGAGGNEDADGEAEATPAEAPQAPRAGGNEDAEGEAEAAPAEDADGEAEAKPAEPPQAKAPQAKPVDQPTAVFKAVRPKADAPVDQPTTMLKLKDDIRPDRKPAPKPAPKPAAKPAAKADLTAPTTALPQVGPERTTQQPLPPKPPLDLLAELTNTPPPPETPVRTVVRRIKIWTPVVLLLAIIFAVVQAVRPLPSPTLALTGKDSYTFAGASTNLPWPNQGQGVIDVDGIGTMGSFGKQTPAAIGSVAKTMTSYIILRDHPLKPGQEGPRIKVDATAEKEGGYDKSGGESTLNTVKAGQYLTEKQALSAVMIPSANNIARLLARWDAGSEAAFVKKMNATARQLGMTHTTYTDPSGLKESTISTARDQVKLGRAVVKNPALVAITSAASWTDPSGYNWPNVNELPYRIGAIGIKTGSTTAAGGNLLFASRKTVGGQTVTIVGAILGQHKTPIIGTANAVSKTALLAAQGALTSATILKKGDVVGYVDDGLGGHTPVVLTKDVTAVGWSGLKVKLSFVAGTVPHTAKAGTTVGTLTVGDGTAAAVKVPVTLQKDLAEPGFGAKLTRLG
ncbi:D-alanyl-D-alanine carboxypeptidase [Streptomyces sp. NPDC127190]|uniref:D-alanyl-D-alanine carboxypeptidase n=1 Tax=unclassified Streptomyces TaxID=2593676 RepID=UPI0036317AB3